MPISVRYFHLLCPTSSADLNQNSLDRFGFLKPVSRMIFNIKSMNSNGYEKKSNSNTFWLFSSMLVLAKIIQNYLLSAITVLRQTSVVFDEDPVICLDP